MPLKRNIGYKEHFRITSLTIKVTTGKKKRISIKIIEHVRKVKARSKFLKDDNVLTIVGVERMFIICHAIAVGIAIFIHNAACFTRAGFTEYISDFQSTPAIGILRIAEHGASSLDFFYIHHGTGDS